MSSFCIWISSLNLLAITLYEVIVWFPVNWSLSQSVLIASFVKTTLDRCYVEIIFESLSLLRQQLKQGAAYHQDISSTFAWDLARWEVQRPAPTRWRGATTPPPLDEFSTSEGFFVCMTHPRAVADKDPGRHGPCFETAPWCYRSNGLLRMWALNSIFALSPCISL